MDTGSHRKIGQRKSRLSSNVAATTTLRAFEHTLHETKENMESSHLPFPSNLEGQTSEPTLSMYARGGKNCKTGQGWCQALNVDCGSVSLTIQGTQPKSVWTVATHVPCRLGPHPKISVNCGYVSPAFSGPRQNGVITLPLSVNPPKVGNAPLWPSLVVLPGGEGLLQVGLGRVHVSGLAPPIFRDHIFHSLTETARLI